MMSHRGPGTSKYVCHPPPSPMEPKTLKWSPKLVQKCNKRFGLNWLGIFTVLVSKIASNSRIFDTFFETHDFAKISVSPRREHDFRGSEPAKWDRNHFENHIEKKLGNILKFNPIFLKFRPLLGTLGRLGTTFLACKIQLFSMWDLK